MRNLITNVGRTDCKEKNKFSTYVVNSVDKPALLCHNLFKSKQVTASNILNDEERDPVAQSGNYQRAVGRCETVAQTVSEVPSGVGRSKPQASKSTRVRPLERRSIKPVLLLAV